jgi:hypothetical protein
MLAAADTRTNPLLFTHQLLDQRLPFFCIGNEMPVAPMIGENEVRFPNLSGKRKRAQLLAYACMNRSVKPPLREKIEKGLLHTSDP